MLNLEPNERIIKQVRKHWLPFVAEMLFIGFLSLIPLVAYIFVPESVSDGIERFAQGNIDVLFVFFYLLWLAIMWLVLFYIWTDYYLDVWVITNLRIIDIEQKGFFHREVSNFRLDRIQDITVTVNGIIATFLGFGDILVQTAGSEQQFKIPNAGHPESVKRVILDAYAEIKE